MAEDLSSLLENKCFLICTVSIKEGKKVITDTNGTEREMDTDKTFHLPGALKIRLKKKLEQGSGFEERGSFIWLLTRIKAGRETLLQIGRSKSFELMWKNDLHPDIRAVITEKKDNNYGSLLTENNILCFYLLDLGKYLAGDPALEALGLKSTDNEHLKSICGEIRAACAEGRLAVEYEPSLWVPGVPDGDFYKYYGGARAYDIFKRSKLR